MWTSPPSLFATQAMGRQLGCIRLRYELPQPSSLDPARQTGYLLITSVWAGDSAVLFTSLPPLRPSCPLSLSPSNHGARSSPSKRLWWHFILERIHHEQASLDILGPTAHTGAPVAPCLFPSGLITLAGELKALSVAWGSSRETQVFVILSLPTERLESTLFYQSCW